MKMTWPTLRNRPCGGPRPYSGSGRRRRRQRARSRRGASAASPSCRSQPCRRLLPTSRAAGVVLQALSAAVERVTDTNIWTNGRRSGSSVFVRRAGVSQSRVGCLTRLKILPCRERAAGAILRPTALHTSSLSAPHRPGAQAGAVDHCDRRSRHSVCAAHRAHTAWQTMSSLKDKVRKEAQGRRRCSSNR